jgi:predicted PurR-regulated permease PerM
MTTPSKASTVSTSREHREHRAMQVLAGVALLCFLWVAKPVATGLLLGALVAFVLQPLFNRLRRKRLGPVPAAVLCSVGSLLLIAAALAGVGFILVSRGLVLIEALPAAVAPDGVLHPLAEHAGRLLAALHVAPGDAMARVRAGIGGLALQTAGFAADLTGAVGSALLMLLFLGLTTFYVLLRWPAMVTRAERDLPFDPMHTRALLGEFHKVGREILFGTVAAGLLHGLLAGLGCWMTGVPEATFWGALTAILSLVPGIGTALVWLSVGVFRVLTGHVVSGVIEVAYGAVVVGLLVDYVVRPRLVGRGHLPALLTLVGLLGGVVVFGLIGLIVGPVLVSLCVAVIDIYDREVVSESAPPG